MATELKPPGTLSKEAREWWSGIQKEYGIEDQAGLLLLKTAAEAYDRMTAARERLKTEGLTFSDAAGNPKVHPLCAVERDARSQLIQALKALNLDLMPLRDAPGRPAGR